MVQTARTEAGRLLADARSQARDLVDAAQREARMETEKILAAAETDALREKAERLARAAKDIETNICLDAATAGQAVEAALRCVCGTPNGKDP